LNQAEANGAVMDEALFAEREINEDASFFCLPVKKVAQRKGKLFKKLLKKKKEEAPVDTHSFPALMDGISETAAPLEEIKASDLSFVLFTSGSTSDPKGVMISHGNLFAHLKTLKKVYGFDQDTRLLNILTLYHVDGSIQGPLLTLFSHATLLRPFSFDMSRMTELFDSIYKLRATHFMTVPTILSFMDKYSEGYEESFQTDDFKLIISTAAKLEKKFWEDFQNKFKVEIGNVYGMTETVAGSLYCGAVGYPKKIGTVGVPIDCEVKILKEDGTEAAVNESGNLMIKGDHIFTGYLNNPEATVQVLQDGWLFTGDIAARDEEGFFSITGRKKNTINTGGINIYPEQVTEMINSHEAVFESVCFALPDEHHGEMLAAAIVVKPGHQLEKMDLITYLRPLLEANQIPKESFFLKSLPRTLSGKIQINEVKALIEEHKAGLGLPQDSSDQVEYVDEIKASAAEAFNISVSEISLQDNSMTLEGWDSLAHLKYVNSLEKKFNVRFSTAEMMIMNSLKATENILLEKLNCI
ncbi:MAG: AMP-binding protein, partial [Bacteroidota bacterium]